MKRPVIELAHFAYPRSASLRSTFCKGAAAGVRGDSDESNPYAGKYPATGFVVAFRNAWMAGWAAGVRGNCDTNGWR